MYNFFENNIASGFIKELIANTKLPIYNFVKKGDFVIKDCLYIYE